MEKITEYLTRCEVGEGQVRAWEEDIMLPTYGIGKEEKNPIFLEKRVYQGSCGSVYPYPVVEKIEDVKFEKKYKALFLENEYIKMMVLPELGGRVQMAYDKIKKRHFVYYNQVIKPALVGLTGPWISGGIEFNWPQHHRPSTFLPTDYSIEENPDGSKTIWCNEVERMFRTKGMHGFTLYPGKAYIEIKAKVYNRTSFPQTFLWWANPAVVVNEHYHSVFPPDVNAVFDHGKRAVSSFPIATGVYYKQDYSSGVDISKYKNIPVPTSYMAIRSKFDFVGGYEEDKKGGLLHVADHHVSPGKKQWTWGNGDFGVAWDRNLTDEDGPYIELMTGVYTDNQPDFTWLQPYEEKSWVQYFMPYAEVGYVKNATKDLILNVDVQGNNTKLILYATGKQPKVRVLVKDVSGKILFDNEDIPYYDPNKDNIVAEVSTKKIMEYGNGKYKVVLVDCGVKNNILRCLLKRDVTVKRVPWNYDFTKEKFDGIFLSNGPGDPSRCGETIENIRKALKGNTPIMGICLGNQLMARAAGASTYKLKYGHRSHNQPVMNPGGTRCYITSQNHGFAIDETTLPADWEPLFVNVNDGTNEGIRHKKKPFFSAQFHPEASSGPVDTEFLFDNFITAMKSSKK